MKTDKGINTQINPKLGRQLRYQNEMGRRQLLRIYCAIVFQEANESSSRNIWNKALFCSVTACKVRVSDANSAPVNKRNVGASAWVVFCEEAKPH